MLLRSEHHLEWLTNGNHGAVSGVIARSLEVGPGINSSRLLSSYKADAQKGPRKRIKNLPGDTTPNRNDILAVDSLATRGVSGALQVHRGA